MNRDVASNNRISQLSNIMAGVVHAFSVNGTSMPFFTYTVRDRHVK